MDKGLDTPRLALMEERPDGKKRGGVRVNNLSEHPVETPQDVLNLIQRAQERRRVGETRMKYVFHSPSSIAAARQVPGVELFS